MWSDNETSTDLLGFRVHAELIRDLVIDPTLLPVTIGIFGDWGSGKTSIMKMVAESLEAEDHGDSPLRDQLEKTAVVYFNGWTFEGYDDAKSALLSSILLELAEHRKFGPKVRERVGDLLASVNWMRVASFGIKDVGVPALMAFASHGTTAVPWLVGTLKKIAGGKAEEKEPEEDSAEEEDEGEDDDDKKSKKAKKEIEGFLKKAKPKGPSSVREFRKKFADLLKKCDIDSLVVVIDDLDRCTPERIIDNFEAIKLFVNVENTAFVIGADLRIVRHAVERRYPVGEFPSVGADQARAIVRDYIEKIIQIPYHLPRLSHAEVETYLTLLFCTRHLKGQSMYDAVMAAYHNQREQNRYGAFGYGDVRDVHGAQPMLGALQEDLGLVNASARLITEGLEGNPRQVKRFLNALMLRKKLAGIARIKIRDDVLVKLMVLEYAENDRFKDLFGWQQEGEDGKASKLAEIEGGRGADIPSWSSSFIKRWLAMAPPLSEVDLRDYFWVARDRLSDSMLGTTLLSPAVRTAKEAILDENDAMADSAVNLVRSLTPSELRSLLDELAIQFVREPTDNAAFEALRRLADAEIDGVDEIIVAALAKVPSRKLSANVGLDLRTLMVKERYKDVFSEAVAAIAADTSTMAGAALCPRQDKK
jgi:predicted KAP-like P-loop ATPase